MCFCVLALLGGGSRSMPPPGKIELIASRRGLFLHSSLGILGKSIWSNYKILYKQFLEICVFGQFYIICRADPSIHQHISGTDPGGVHAPPLLLAWLCPIWAPHSTLEHWWHLLRPPYFQILDPPLYFYKILSSSSLLGWILAKMSTASSRSTGVW